MMKESTFKQASEVFEQACDLFLEDSKKHTAWTSLDERMLVHNNFVSFCNIHLQDLNVTWEEFLDELETRRQFRHHQFSATK